jgi:hypothetical protein
MGRRGRLSQYGERIAVRFPPAIETQVVVLAEWKGESLAGMVRHLVAEAITHRMGDVERRNGSAQEEGRTDP